VLKQEQEGYEFCQQQMAECDRQLEQYLQQREDRSRGASLPEEVRKGRLVRRKGNKPAFALRAELFRITGTDLTQVDGIDVVTATTILSVSPRIRKCGFLISRRAKREFLASSPERSDGWCSPASSPERSGGFLVS